MKPFAIEAPQGTPFDHFVTQEWIAKFAKFTKAMTTVKAVSAAYTVEPLVYWVRVNATSGAITVTLPPAGVIGRPIGIMKSDSSGNAVTIDGNGSETIEGATTQTLSSQYDAMLLRDNGTSWDVEISNTTSAGGGAVVQVVNTTYSSMSTTTTTVPIDDTIPQNTEGAEFFTRSITPTNSSNKLLIEVVTNVTTSSGLNVVTALFQDTTADALAAVLGPCSANAIITVHKLNHWMTAGTTSATTFKVRCGPGAGTLTINGSGGARYLGGVMTSSITITEIEP
jgi:PBP1b-binding outer membrane lipoprotein LpoB